MENAYWEEPTSLNSQVKLESSLSYAGTGNSEDEEYGFHGKKKLARDPLSHRIIEKRRRDRMNSCLADLSRLIPHEYMKKGRGRIEKTEVIEMAIRRIKHLMSRTGGCKESDCGQDEQKEAEDQSQQAQRDHLEELATSYRLGFVECLSETIHFLVQVEGLMATDPFCTQLKTHLSNHCDNILQSEGLRSRLCFSGEDKNDQPALATCESSNTDQDGRTTQFCALQDTGSDTSTGHTYNVSDSPLQLVPSQQQIDNRLQLSPTSSNSEKGTGAAPAEPAPSYKFKNRIQKRFFERNRSSRVPVFVLAPGGAHYLATWLDATSIPGYVELGPAREPPASHHPVTISVDFRTRVGTT
ncbi:hairy/enhancer-of-split related with YRPW motif protein-like isoform X1 [Cimex lectularius]|uniref:Clockwork orange n=1 Tax=Cimex lectularius TaxID=79782 RepID=A0A8I6RSG9_CIMLE|nr:hairy/enhancer-of-split related with YRPW motif protein-like isoform X1 [Cimex lectularius]